MKKVLACCFALFFISSAFVINKKKKARLPDEFVYIPGGTMYMGNPDDVSYHRFDSSKRISIPPFYISRYEVSNQQYRDFYAATAPAMTEPERMLIACDTNAWRETISYCEPMINYYYRHPAYSSYPVVGVSYEGAIAYCRWLQEKLQTANPDYSIEVKLPAKYQWVYAAQAGRSQAMFPWGNYYLRNKKGEYMCNYKRVGDQAIYRDRQTGEPKVAAGTTAAIAGGLNDRAFYTAQVKSYYPNDFGLYNMCGNVAEMISDKGIAMGGSWNDYGGDVHILAEASYDKPLSTTGFRPIILIKEKN